jgi:Raf kinase inhibitor-like YbhB/YbcL family protein
MRPWGPGCTAGVSSAKSLDNGAKHGKNDFRKFGYGGPCPPGGTHRYYFKVYALDSMLNLDAGIMKADLVQAMKGHILVEGQLMGRYKR